MRKRQAKILVASAVILGLALLLTSLSIRIIPQWENAPGGWLALLGAAILVIAGLGGKIKDWVELLFDKEVQKSKTSQSIQDTTPKPPIRLQKMTKSPHGEQSMKGGAGRQEQNMDESPHGKQHME